MPTGFYEATGVFMDSQKKLACGITHLPNDAGLLFKVLGMEPCTGKETCPGLLLACPSGSKGTSCSPRIPSADNYQRMASAGSLLAHTKDVQVVS